MDTEKDWVFMNVQSDEHLLWYALELANENVISMTYLMALKKINNI